METWTRVLLYGTFDGFTFSTDELTRINVVLDSGEIIEVPEDFVVSADQMVNKHKIKLKDVIARIEKFDLATKAVWINEILNKLGSDYGLHKYYTGYKQGKFDGAMEREKVTVLQFVADWYEEHKDELEVSIFHYVNNINKEEESAFKRWFVDSTTRPFQVLVNMHQFGYEIDKEKRYRVKLKSNPKEVDYLVDTKRNGLRFYSNIYTQSREHTRKEIEAAGFGWVFDCPGVEIEEVE